MEYYNRTERFFHASIQCHLNDSVFECESLSLVTLEYYTSSKKFLIRFLIRCLLIKLIVQTFKPPIVMYRGVLLYIIIEDLHL